VAILKTEQSTDSPKSYRPISLLSMSKLTEIVILKRISPIIEKAIPSYQAGFRHSRNFCEQFAALTSHKKNALMTARKSEPLLLTSVPSITLSGSIDY
jgi:hypothetical protein